MKVLIDTNNIVIAKSKEIEKVENGFYVKDQDVVFSTFELTLLETELDPEVQKDKIIDGKIYKNEFYFAEKELKIRNLVLENIITKEQYKTLTGKDFVV
jgi:hypothetical protein